MPTRNANADWRGNLKEGSGHMRFGSGAYDGAFTWSSRFADGKGTNPEELIAAAHAGCFSMALSGDLTDAGKPPKTVKTSAKVHIDRVDGKWTITTVDLDTEAEVPGIDKATFDRVAEGTRAGCPVSRA